MSNSSALHWYHKDSRMVANFLIKVRTMVKIIHSSRGIKVWSLNLFIHSMERVLTAIRARARSFDKNV